MLRLLRQFRSTRQVIHNYRAAALLVSIKNDIPVISNKILTIGPEVPKIFHLCHISTNISFEEVDTITFERVCEETLESLTDFFEELVESHEKFKSADVSFSSGVLTVNLGQYGTYVINRQSPNKQIWLSSPTSGPKRYDFATKGNYWVYKHDMKPLHELLQKELSNILGENVNMTNCKFSSIIKC